MHLPTKIREDYGVLWNMRKPVIDGQYICKHTPNKKPRRFPWLVTAIFLCVLLAAGAAAMIVPGALQKGSSGAACSHRWSNATCASPQTCTKCGLTQGTTLDHVIGKTGNDFDAVVCSVCKQTVAPSVLAQSLMEKLSIDFFEIDIPDFFVPVQES